jgi:hypothetical protein
MADVAADDQADRMASTPTPTLDQMITLHPPSTNAPVMNNRLASRPLIMASLFSGQSTTIRFYLDVI